MTVDRYTKLVLTVIAVCLVWISVGGPSLLTPVSAQQAGLGDRVILAGWVDAKGNVLSFPAPPTNMHVDSFGRPTNQPPSPPAVYPLPISEWLR